MQLRLGTGVKTFCTGIRPTNNRSMFRWGKNTECRLHAFNEQESYSANCCNPVTERRKLIVVDGVSWDEWKL